MIVRMIVLVLAITAGYTLAAQSTYLLPGMKEEWWLNRAEIRYGSPGLQYSTARPFSRQNAVSGAISIDSIRNLPVSDRYNLHSFLMANSEWTNDDSGFMSRKPVLRHFYRNKANAFELERQGVNLVFNPIIQYQQYREKNNQENVFLNSRGLQARGLIDDRIGFSFYFTENQERTPSYVNAWVNRFQAVPGVGYFKAFKNSATAYDYFDTRASVSWRVSRYLNMQLGYDRNFIGNGYRSLLLSDFSNNYSFLKLNTRWGRFQYQNIFAELLPFYPRTGDRVLPRKYFRAHYLEFAASKEFHIGLFEGTMLGRSDRLTVGLFNPVIFLQLPRAKKYLQDRSYIGLNAKANLFQQLQVYGQVVIDKLKTSGLANKTWDNRFGWQAGLKYLDIFGLKNTDLQLETNRVRPYTYAANDSITSYSHYNQPLAHPLGANFQEYIAILRAQPLPALQLQVKLVGYRQGLDFAGYNMGNNPFAGFNNRLSDVRVRVGDGDPATVIIASMLASFELRQNLFIEAAYTSRDYETGLGLKNKTSFISLGLRWNMARREFDF